MMVLSFQDHLMDVNANVRSRVVQLWCRLADSQQIPIAFIRNGIIADIAERTGDKSLLVRKNAAHFFCVFIKKNPFGPDVCM